MYTLDISYRPGPKIPVPDALSDEFICQVSPLMKIFSLEPEENVRVRENGSWIPAIITSTSFTLPFYVVKTESGTTLGRNGRNFLKEAPSSSSLESDEETTTSAAKGPSPRTFESPNNQVAVHLTCPRRSVCRPPGVAELSSPVIRLIREHVF